MLSVHYGLNKEEKYLAKYVKLHVDDGIELIYKEFSQKLNMSGQEFIIDNIERGLKKLS
jgi:DNA sulfur modification protein DndE